MGHGALAPELASRRLISSLERTREQDWAERDLRESFLKRW